MHYPTYTGRKGSKCYFTYDSNFFNKNREKCLELVALNTLYLFGHQENNNDVLLVSKTSFKQKKFKHCLKLLFNDKLNHRLFHLPKTTDKKLMVAFSGPALVTNEIVPDKLACKTKRKHDKYPCMYDKFNVCVQVEDHVFDEDDDIENSEFYVGKRTGNWDTSVEPCCDVGQCQFCDAMDNNKFDKEKFVIRGENDDENDDNENDDNENDDDENDDDENDEISDIKLEHHIIIPRCYKQESDAKIIKRGKILQIIMNNLIFDFKNYQFNMTIKKNKCHITFDPKAIGGYKHASISTGAPFEVYHAIPGSLQHYQTTYVNSMTIIFSELDDEIIIVSEYKAIDVL